MLFRSKRPRHSNRIPSRPHCFSPSIILSSIVLVSRSRQNYRRNAATTWQPYARPFNSFWLSPVWKTLSHSQHVAWLCSERNGMKRGIRLSHSFSKPRASLSTTCARQLLDDDDQVTDQPLAKTTLQQYALVFSRSSPLS